VEFATERARLLLGQFRRGEANDPGTFVTSIAAVLARYSEAIVATVTDPRMGLATATDWLPTVREVVEACEKLAVQEAIANKREAVTAKTLAARSEELPRAERPTIDELRAKHGPNWGINAEEREAVTASHQRLATRMREQLERDILAQYASLGREPIYAGEWLVSLELAEQNRVRGGIGSEGEKTS